MTQYYKSCPNCDMPADLNAVKCARCGHPFIASAPMPGWETPGVTSASSFGPSGPSSMPPPYMSPMPYATQYTLTPQEVANKRITAGILALLLGAFGIHKFLMGKTQSGVIMLLVTLLSCGIASPIMSVIGLVEGIVYLTKSDAEFYQTYLAGDKQWF